MVMVRSCCLCVNIRTATFILGTVGIILGGVALAPMSVFLEHHSFYVTQFVISEREAGLSMDDNEVPRVAFFSKMLFSILLSLDVIYILSCVLLLVGVAAVRHMLMMPWLIYVLCGILTHVTLVLAFMISLADYGSIGVFLAASPGLSIIIYFFLVVYSCYQMIKKEEISLRGPQTGLAPTSASNASISSLKENIHRVIRGTPPPPYESVTSKSPPKPAKKTIEQSSCSSLVDLLHFSKSSNEQSPRSTPSNSRRSSDGQNSTKPVSPANLRKRISAGGSSDLLLSQSKPSLPSPLIYKAPSASSPSKPTTMTNSQSHSQISVTAKPTMRKSHSSVVSLQHQPADMFIQFSQTSLAPAPATNSTVAETENSELSDETSSMSSTSLSFKDTQIV